MSEIRLQFVLFTNQNGVNHFLLFEFEEAMMVRILMKMFMVSMYIPMDLQKREENHLTADCLFFLSPKLRSVKKKV